MLKDKEAQELFFWLATGVVGNSRTIVFLIDRWVNGRRVVKIAPEVSTRCRNKIVVADVLQWNSWMLDVQGKLYIAWYRQWFELWESVRAIRFEENEEDRFVWTGAASGRYTTKEAYKFLCQGGGRWVLLRQSRDQSRR
jgi:hypothetical protein